jgi:GT2 family glycosyltransferase
MKTLVGVVAWNGGRHLAACLTSLLAQEPVPDVLVVDNASDDGSAELAGSFGERFGGRLQVLAQASNLGFTAGANVALRHALSRGEHEVVVLLNQDATLEGDYVARIAELFERRPEAGVAGARILYPDGATVQHAGGWLDRPRLLGRHRGQYQRDGPDFDVEQDVEFATGAVLALRVACLRAVGVFDEVFSPGYYEDVDLCVRAREAGWSVVYAPRARARHAESASFSDALERWTFSHCSRLMFALPQLVAPAAAAEFAAAERASFAEEPLVVVRAQARAYLEALLRLPRAVASRLPPEARPAAAAIAELLASLRTDCLATLRQRTQDAAGVAPQAAPTASESATPVQACTIVARDYLAHARVLARSFAAHHPGGCFTVLLVDDEGRRHDDSAEPFRCLRLHEIGLAPPEVQRLAAIYEVTELATAVKPVLLRHLLSAGADHVIYLDPDTEVFAPLDRAARLAGSTR